MATKTRVVLLYGGRSAEHEISCRSAAFVLRNLDPAKYEVDAVAIDKDGKWLPQNTAALREGAQGLLPISQKSPLAEMPALPAGAKRSAESISVLQLKGSTRFTTENGVTRDGANEDVVFFPVLHGTFGEDGTLQGLFEMVETAFVGPDTLGSAVGMDKVVAKRLAAEAGVPIVPYIAFRAGEFQANPDRIVDRAIKELGLPLFVKPARLGSSIGISKVKEPAKLQAAILDALRYDDKILIEKGLDVREIECAVLGGYDPDVSIPGEVIPHAEFYTYEAKYIDADGAGMAIPAKLTPEQTEAARQLAKQTFQALELYGMARVDLFLDKNTGKFYLNEVNTIPGFTEISQYPMLWRASGLTDQQLLDRLVQLAIARRDQKKRLLRERS